MTWMWYTVSGEQKEMYVFNSSQRSKGNAHLSPNTIVPQRAGPRVAALGLGRFHPLVAVAVAAAVSVLTDHHPPLEAARTRTGTLRSTHSVIQMPAPTFPASVHCPFSFLFVDFWCLSFTYLDCHYTWLYISPKNSPVLWTTIDGI